jgi:hypothetical protein
MSPSISSTRVPTPASACAKAIAVVDLPSCACVLVSIIEVGAPWEVEN